MSVNGLRPYPAYRESGVQWLGKVPEHWEVRRASSRLHVRNRPIHPREISQGEIFHYSIPNVQQHGGGRREATSSVDSGKTLVDRELLLVSKLNPRKGTIALAVPHPTLTTIASGEFVTMEPGACLGVFARYVYVSESVRLELSSRVNSATKSHQRCTPEDIAKLRVPWPPTDEQTAIARFLDDADRRIRRYIRAKERLIELLQERKRALIHEAVTGRTDVSTGQPYPAYKDSGVQWLGKVPKHWEVSRLKNVARLVYGDSLAASSRRSGDIPVYGSNGQVGLHDMANTEGPVVIVGRKGSFGRVNFSGSPVFAIDTTFFVDGRSTSVNLRLLYHLLSWLRLDEVTKDSAIPGLDREDAYGRIIGLPPLPEQRAIARFLEAADRRIRRHISATKRQIALLKEYRTRLIADVVTGKLDVREASGDPAVTSFSP